MSALTTLTTILSTLSPVRKKSLADIDRSRITELQLTEDQAREFKRGIELFNQRKYWEAHEVWEQIWKQRQEDSRIFFQAIIQAAAAYYRVTQRPSYVGALNNFEKAFQKLEAFPDEFLGVDVERLRRAIFDGFEEVKRLGPTKVGEFPQNLLTKLDVR